MTTRIKIKVEAYDISASGYKTGMTDNSNNAGDGVGITDDNRSNWFKTIAYTSLPNESGTDPITGNDISANFTKASYSSVDDAKTALLSATINTAISNNVQGTPTYSLDSGNLVMECYFADETKLKSFSSAVIAFGAWKIDGAVVSHVTS